MLQPPLSYNYCGNAELEGARLSSLRLHRLSPHPPDLSDDVGNRAHYRYVSSTLFPQVQPSQLAARLEESLDQNQIIIDNLCILWFPEHEVGNVKATITSVCVPTKLAHLEVFLPSRLLTHPFTTSPDDLEAFVLRRHLDGSLRRVTVTVEDPSELDILDDAFKELNSLGILNIRVGKPPLFHPLIWA